MEKPRRRTSHYEEIISFVYEVWTRIAAPRVMISDRHGEAGTGILNGLRKQSPCLDFHWMSFDAFSDVSMFAHLPGIMIHGSILMKDNHEVSCFSKQALT